MVKRGVLLSLLTAVISGFSIFSNKIFISQTDPLVFTTIRNVLVGLILSVVLIVTGKHRQLVSISQKDWLKLLFIGTFGGGLAFALFFTGLAKIGAVQGNLIHKTLFIWVAFMAYSFLGERLHPRKILGYVVLMLGTFWGGTLSFSISYSALLVFLATLLWAVENVVAKQTLKNVSPVVLGWARIVFGLPVLMILSFILGKGGLFITSKTYLFLPLITSSIFLSMYILSWYKALAYAPATIVTSVLAISPLITNFLTALFITYQLPPQQSWSAILLSLGASFIILRIRQPRLNLLPK